MKSRIYNKLKNLSPKASWLIALISGLVLVGSVSYGAYSYVILQKERMSILSELENIRGRNYELLRETRNQQVVIDSFQGQIQNISSTVGTLEKLNKTDEELLRKYSKVYFLNENYRPSELSGIDQKYLYNKETDAFIHTQVLPYLKRFLEAARSNSIDLLIASAFRSYETQISLKSEYKMIYGAGTANQFSADQGYSEHQLGTSVDFTTPNVGGAFSKFESDPAYLWLIDNAHKYGFVLSYPKGNAYYRFEPWHWRFVGVSLAEKLHADNKYFYDLDQRDIDTYLIKLFD